MASSFEEGRATGALPERRGKKINMQNGPLY